MNKRNIILIVLLLHTKMLFSQAKSIRSYTAYYFISQTNLIRFKAFVSDLEYRKPKIYREELIQIIDSIFSTPSKIKMDSNVQDSIDRFNLLRRAKSRLYKNKKINRKDKIGLTRVLFSFLITNKGDSNESSCYETDLFLDTFSKLESSIDTNYFISKHITERRNTSPFAFSKSYPEVNIYYKRKSIKEFKMNQYYFVNKDFLDNQVESNKRLNNLIQALNQNYIVIVLQTYYP